MNIFKVGDKARIRKDLEHSKFYDTCTGTPCFCNESMTTYGGMAVVVEQKWVTSGFIELRSIGDGASRKIPWNWSDDMLEPLEEEKKKRRWPLKVGETVRIRCDIADRTNKDGRIWVTLHGKKFKSYCVSDEILSNAGEEVVITKAWKDIGHIGNVGYSVRNKECFDDLFGNLDITMFDCFHDWFDDRKRAGKPSDESAPDFKVGDEVVRKLEVNLGDTIDKVKISAGMYNSTFDPDSEKLRVGKIVKIEEVDGVKLALIDFLNGKGMYYRWPLGALAKAEDYDAKPTKKFKVGDKAVIKTTVSSGERVGHVTIQPFMFRQAYDEHKRRRIGVVIDINEHGSLEVDFGIKGESVFTWPAGALELYSEKSSEKKRKKPDSKADYSGYTPKSEFYCYDYLNRKATFCKGAMENITKIEITVMSGDETGCFYGVCNGEPWQYRFDTMTTSRFQSYDDGSYTVEGRENIEKWINWSYDPEKAIYAEYSMERMRAFKR